MSNVPADATHVSDFYGIKTYWKKDVGILINGKIHFRGVESGEPFYSWYSWDGSTWIIETCVRDTHFKELSENV